MTSEQEIRDRIIQYFVSCGAVPQDSNGNYLSYWSDRGFVSPNSSYATFRINTSYDSIFGTSVEKYLKSSGSYRSVRVEDAGVMSVRYNLWGASENDAIYPKTFEMNRKAGTGSSQLKSRQKNTVTITTTTPGSVYSLFFCGELISYTSAITDTVLEIRNGLVSAILANEYLTKYGFYAVNGSSSNKFVIAGEIGTEFNVLVGSKMSSEKTEEALIISPYMQSSITNGSGIDDNHYKYSFFTDIDFYLKMTLIKDDVRTINQISMSICAENVCESFTV